MARRCAVTGRGVQTGNNVSHAHNRNRRRFLPNLHPISLHSEILNSTVRLKVSAYGLRTVEKRGGIDSYLLSANDEDLSKDALRVKKRIKKIKEKAAELS